MTTRDGDSQAPGAESEPQSRSQKRRDAVAVTRLGEELVGLTPGELRRLDLDPDLASAVEACRGFKKKARVRHLRLIGQMLRGLDHQAIGEAIRTVHQPDAGVVLEERNHESWRERLMDEGDAAVNDFVTQYPAADRQQLRQLIRSGSRTPESGPAKRARRELLRIIRELRS